MVKLDTIVSSYLLLVFSLVVRSIYLAEPANVAAAPVGCKPGFLGLGCAKGCSKVGGKCVQSTAAAPSPPPSGPSGHALMRKRSTQSCLAAADAFESSGELMLAADALNCACRIRGNGNILLVEGTLDTPDNKKFWGQHGPKALVLIRAAFAADASLQADPRAKLIELDAFMFGAASKGIIRQAVTGAGVEFKRLADEFTAAYPSWDGGVGYTFLCGFYHVAPWPLGDKKRAIVEAESAVAVSGRSRRNTYYVCLFKYLAGDKDGAAAACAAASAARCEGSEADYCSFLSQQAARVTALAKKM